LPRSPDMFTAPVITLDKALRIDVIRPFNKIGYIFKSFVISFFKSGKPGRHMFGSRSGTKFMHSPILMNRINFFIASRTISRYIVFNFSTYRRIIPADIFDRCKHGGYHFCTPEFPQKTIRILFIGIPAILKNTIHMKRGLFQGIIIFHPGKRPFNSSRGNIINPILCAHLSSF